MKLFRIFLMTFLLAGCTRTVYVPMPSVSVERNDHSVNATDIEKDRSRESTREQVTSDTKVTVNENGDTLRTDTRFIYLRDRETERENERLRAIVDSLRSVKVDSVPVPYPVERELSRWERTKVDFGGYAMALLGAVIAVAVTWLARRRK
jgi:hypothetical protein